MDITLPSPKRPRIDEVNSQVEQSSIQTSLLATTGDELDDLYGTPPSTTPSLTQPLNAPIPTSREQDETSGTEAAKQKFRLPGIGAQILEQSCGPIKSLNEDIAADKVGLETAENPAKESSNDGNSLHQVSEGLKNDHAAENVPQTDRQVSQNAEDDERIPETGLAKAEAVLDSETAAMSASSLVSSDNSAPCPKETNIGLGQETRSPVNINPNIDVASLSQQLPPVAVEIRAEPQYSSHPQPPKTEEVNASAGAHVNTVQEGQAAISELEEGSLGQENRDEDGGVHLKSFEEVAKGSAQYSSHSQSPKTEEVHASTEAHVNTVQNGQTAIPQLEEGTLGQEESKEDGGVQLKTFEEVAEGNKADVTAEFQLDSSPHSGGGIETACEDSDDDYQPLGPEEQARRLMQEDGGSDDDGAGKTGAGSSSGPPRTQNEKPDEIVPKPNVIVTPEMHIEELGLVEAIVENTVLIEAKISGESQVLETGSVLCLADRNVIGVVAETLGRVQRPYYSVRFSNPAEIADAGITKGTQIFYSVQHSITVFTQSLKTYKGSDASNLHDEEVGDDEMEFSDDEKEAEYKKSLKQAKQARRESKIAATDGFSRAPGRGRGRNRGRPAPGDGRPFQKPASFDGTAQINYDDADVDGPYNTLARPHNLHEIMGRSEAPIETQTSTLDAYRGSYGGRGPASRGRGRGRGNLPRSYQDRAGDLQGHDDYGLATSFYSAAHEDQQSAAQYSHSFQYNTVPPSPYSALPGFTADRPIIQGQPSPAVFNYQNHQQQSPQHYYNSFPNQAPLPNLPPGALVNPAFFTQPSHSNQYSHPDPSAR